jgi:uncharacterized cupin superfamily protein
MQIKNIIRLSADPEGFGQTPDKLSPDMFVSEIPVQHTHEYFQDEELGLYVGVWDTTEMIETAGPYPCDEFMCLLEGEAVIRNCKTGEMEKVNAGESFIIPKGYDCQWQQAGYLRKFFLISENPNEAVPEKPAIEGIIIPDADAPMESLTTEMPFPGVKDLPVQKQHISYKNGKGNFLAGTWESDPFESESRSFPYNEFARVISGSLTLLDEDGEKHLFEAGDALFIPEGVHCSAHAAVKVKLFFAIVKPAQTGKK